MNARTRRVRPGSPAAALLATLGLLLATAGPASAATGNHGDATSGTGQEDSITYGADYGTTANPFCLEVTASSYSVDFSSTELSADDGPDDAQYTGAATLTFSTTETYYVGPDGTYTDADFQNGCDATTLGDPIAATVSVTGGNSTNGVDCGPDDAEYARLTNQITLDWEGVCTVTQSSLSVDTPSTTDHSLDATLNACFNPPNPCTASTITDAGWAYS